MQIVVDKQYLIHDGGTKFYQAIRVKNMGPTEDGLVSGKVVTVTHWGAQKDLPGPLNVVSAGQNKVEAGDTYQEKISAKKKRGYQAQKVAWGTTKTYKSRADLDAYLVAEFGMTGAREVLTLLGGSLSSAPSAFTAPVTPAGRPVVEKVAAAAELEGWGEF